jgi:hypothetical protein
MRRGDWETERRGDWVTRRDDGTTDGPRMTRIARISEIRRSALRVPSSALIGIPVRRERAFPTEPYSTFLVV